MAAFKLVHVGVNADSPEEAVRTARMFEALFGLPVEEGSSSVFAGTAVEVMKPPYRGTHGHIGFGVSDVAAAKEELEAKGVVFDEASAKTGADGALRVIYLRDEIGGFAVHLVKV